LSTTIIEIPQWGHITLIEILWTTIGLFTVIFVLAMLRIVTLGMLGTPKGTIERDASVAYVRREIVRLLQGLCIFGVGVYVTFFAASPPGPAFITIPGLAITIALFGIAGSVVLQSILDWRARRKIIGEIQKRGIEYIE
jgi:SNF family Na+-dependent transporter